MLTTSVYVDLCSVCDRSLLARENLNRATTSHSTGIYVDQRQQYGFF